MIFTEEQYKHLNFIAPNLSSYAEFMGQLGKDMEKGEIELLFRKMDHKQKFQFEAVIAHPKTFQPEWEKVVFKTKILAYHPITSAKYDFKSRAFEGLDSVRILGEYVSRADALCDEMILQREIKVVAEKPKQSNSQELYSLRGWIQGPVRASLVAHNYLQTNLGRGIGITGTLSYKQGNLN